MVVRVLGWTGREIERYSLEHMKGIGNESQRANGVPCLCKVDISCQQSSILRKRSRLAKHVKAARLRTDYKFHEEENDIKNK